MYIFFPPLESLQLNLLLEVVNELAKGAEFVAPTAEFFWTLQPAFISPPLLAR